jgi:hypothetical protein
VEAVKSLLGDPALASHIVYKPTKVFTNDDKTDRIYTELWTGQWWHVVQVRINDISFKQALLT